MGNLVKSGLKKLLFKFGYSLSHVNRGLLENPSFEGAIERLSLRKPQFQSVIDVGAAVGGWSSALANKFPDREHLLIEANPVHAPALESICRKNPGWSYVLKACGPKSGTIYFDGKDPFGGQAQQVNSGDANQSLPMTTIDHEIVSHKLKPPFLIKLDTHGFELPIFEGAKDAFSQTEVLVVESYNFVIGNEAVQFWTLCELLSKWGFLPIDLFDVMYRPRDKSLWQMDIVFMRSSRPEFNSNQYL